MWLDSIEKKVSKQVGETGTYFILFKSASKKIRELISWKSNGELKQVCKKPNQARE
ncbi:hypothetical protein HanOQP8_Chr15g0581801 [Helianthus annuus]|nr:hypothetical protein HanIR_Chr11g0553121 [Helianthus annuus]KAJ0597614.1 hypothetical protein HanHA89_Chr04g0156621 [Helianthus annuus]KAJ0653286.1 hypothetical protein HanOQP8_Chr15g0581801 [Helianthus annuus]